MMIAVKVVARARQEKIQLMPDGSYKIWVRVAAEKGRANDRVRELLASHFRAAKTQVRLLRGQSGPHKLIEIL